MFYQPPRAGTNIRSSSPIPHPTLPPVSGVFAETVLIKRGTSGLDAESTRPLLIYINKYPECSLASVALVDPVRGIDRHGRY